MEKPRTSVRRLASIALPHMPWLVSGTVGLLIAAFAELMLTREGGRIVDQLTAADKVDGMARVDAAFLRIGLQMATMAFIKHLGELLLRIAGERVVESVRSSLFRALLAQEVGFFDHNSTGSLVSVLSADVEALQLAIAFHLPDVVRYGIITVCSAAAMASISWRLTLLGLLVAPPIGLLASVLGSRLQRLAHRQQLQLGVTTAAAMEGLSSVRCIKVT